MALTDAERKSLEAYRADVHMRETAYQRAADDAARRVQAALHHIRNQNYGLAADWLEDLLGNGLPNDHGGPVTRYPLFEERLAALRSNR